MTTQITPAQAALLLDDLTAIVVQALEAIQAVPSFNVPSRLKNDQSPVTAADEASEAKILDGLARLLPGVPVLSEEAFNRSPPGELGRSFLLVDPLDGTREYLAGLDEYAVNVAIVTDGVPVGGIVAAPALGLIWRGADGKADRMKHFGRGGVGERTPIRTRAWPAGEARAVVSRSHLDKTTEDYLSRFNVTRTPCGSALKFCQLAQGDADIYPRFGPTSEWDIASGHAVLAAAGGAMTATDGSALAYGQVKSGFVVPGFLAWGDAARAKDKT